MYGYDQMSGNLTDVHVLLRLLPSAASCHFDHVTK